MNYTVCMIPVNNCLWDFFMILIKHESNVKKPYFENIGMAEWEFSSNPWLNVLVSGCEWKRTQREFGKDRYCKDRWQR